MGFGLSIVLLVGRFFGGGFHRRRDPSAGAGETPIITIAPAIGNAIFAATQIRLRSLPMVPNGLKV